MEKYIYTGPTGLNSRLGHKTEGQELDYVPEKFKDELLRNNQIKIKSDKAVKQSKKIVEQQLKTKTKKEK